MTDRHVQKMLTFREMLAVNFAHLEMFVNSWKIRGKFSFIFPSNNGIKCMSGTTNLY